MRELAKHALAVLTIVMAAGIVALIVFAPHIFIWAVLVAIYAALYYVAYLTCGMVIDQCWRKK